MSWVVTNYSIDENSRISEAAGELVLVDHPLVFPVLHRLALLTPYALAPLLLLVNANMCGSLICLCPSGQGRKSHSPS